MSLAKKARAIERYIFGALLGTLAGVMVCRLALLAIDLNVFLLVALPVVGAWSGGFVAHFGSNRSDLAVQSLKAWAIRFRRVCLRIMLWLVGAAAVFGVLSVLTANYDVVGRIAGTAALTALAAGLLWPFSILMDRDSYRGVGLFGAASVILIYVLVTPSIWNVGHHREETALAALIVALMMPVGLVIMMLIHTRVARIAGLVGIGLYALVLAVFLTALWYPGGWYRNEELWGAGFALSGFGLIALANLVGVATGDRRHWRWIGVLTAAVACVICICASWKYQIVDEDVIIVITSVAIAIGHANLAMFVPLKGTQAWLRTATICVVAITAFFLDVDLLLSLSKTRQISIFGRVALASGILASCGTLALIILACLNRAVEHRTVEGEPASMSVTCPKCGTRQTIPLGEGACSRCRLRIHIRIEEPPDEKSESSGET